MLKPLHKRVEGRTWLRARLNGDAFPASLEHVEPNQDDGKCSSGFLEPVSSSRVQMALVRDRRREHGHLDVQRSRGLADDESQSERAFSLAWSGGHQLANVSICPAGGWVGGYRRTAALPPG